MLLLKDIVQFLEPEQVKIPVQVDKLHLEKTLPSQIEAFLKKYVSEDHHLQTLPPIPKNSFLVAFLYLVDPEFAVLSEANRHQVIAELRKTMGFQLDEKNLHKKYGYSRKRRFKKIELQKKLFQIQKSWEEIYPEEVISNPLQQYLIDFFSVNLFIIHATSTTEKVTPLLANIEKPDIYKPTFFMFIENDRFYPLLEKPGQYFILSQHSFLDKFYKKFGKIKTPTKVSIQPKDIIQTTASDDDEDTLTSLDETIPSPPPTTVTPPVEETPEDEETINKILPTPPGTLISGVTWSKLTLKELQTMAAQRKISIWRKSEKTGKNIFKKKAELIQDLQSPDQ